MSCLMAGTYKVTDKKMINPNIEIREGHECEADDNTADISLMQKMGWYPKEPDAAEFINELRKNR